MSQYISKTKKQKQQQQQHTVPSLSIVCQKVNSLKPKWSIRWREKGSGREDE